MLLEAFCDMLDMGYAVRIPTRVHTAGWTELYSRLAVASSRNELTFDLLNAISITILELMYQNRAGISLDR